jgi:hypothetical protein
VLRAFFDKTYITELQLPESRVTSSCNCCVRHCLCIVHCNGILTECFLSRHTEFTGDVHVYADYILWIFFTSYSRNEICHQFHTDTVKVAPGVAIRRFLWSLSPSLCKWQCHIPMYYAVVVFRKEHPGYGKL